VFAPYKDLDDIDCSSMHIELPDETWNEMLRIIMEKEQGEPVPEVVRDSQKKATHHAAQKGEGKGRSSSSKREGRLLRYFRLKKGRDKLPLVL
ncbi:unnamed protein product, partial [Amoebophrya sp. A25]